MCTTQQRLTLLAALSFCAAANASLTFYSNESVFDATTTGLSTQSFGGVAANLGVGVGVVNSIGNPLNNGTNAAMLSGLSITATTNLGSDIAVLGPDYGGSGKPVNYSVFSNYAGGLNFAFGSGVTAASLNLLTLFSSGNVTVSVYDALSNLLGSDLVTGVSTGAGEFWGVTSDGTAIASLTITADQSSGNIYPGVDRVQFGQYVQPSSTPVPEPTSLALVAIAIAGLGLNRGKRSS